MKNREADFRKRPISGTHQNVCFDIYTHNLTVIVLPFGFLTVIKKLVFRHDFDLNIFQITHLHCTDSTDFLVQGYDKKDI